MGKRVVLRDGSEVLIRQVQRGDAPLLADGFLRLSAESRRLRFLSVKPELSPAELRYYTEVDHHDHEALGALNQVDGRGLAIARYIRHTEDPEAAEIAVAVLDDWQGRGLGTELLNQLTDRAGQEGIRRLPRWPRPTTRPWSDCWQPSAPTSVLPVARPAPSNTRSL
jgi:GNAT superfamily N-acetyltransferase